MDLSEKPLKAIHIEESELSFGHGQTCDHPKDGLFLYGPHSGPTRTREVSVGVIGTKDGLSYFRTWAIAAGGFAPVPPRKKTDKENRLRLSKFPGLEEAFGIMVSPGEFVQRTVDYTALDDATRTVNQHEAVRKAVDLYVGEIERYDKNEEKTVDVWMFILPEIIFEHCKPLSRRTGLGLTQGEFAKSQNERIDLPLFKDVIDQSGEDIFDDVPDFHRQVKARLLKVGHTSQLIRETTLAPDKFLNNAGYPKRGLQDPATVAWNLATGLYYKTQPLPPWKLAHVRPGVCYIGLVFKMIPNDPKEHACCAAQMFLNESDAVVFRGANGPWKTDDFEFHLQPKEAQSLIAKVLKTFDEKQHGWSIGLQRQTDFDVQEFVEVFEFSHDRASSERILARFATHLFPQDSITDVAKTLISAPAVTMQGIKAALARDGCPKEKIETVSNAWGERLCNGLGLDVYLDEEFALTEAQIRYEEQHLCHSEGLR
jgi:hypothetical protein